MVQSCTKHSRFYCQICGKPKQKPIEVKIFQGFKILPIRFHFYKDK